MYIQKTKIMASSLITSWEIDGETVETVSDFIFRGSKITADGDCSPEIKRHLLLEGRRKWQHPLQYSCLENPRDRGAWWAAICGVAESRTQLKWLSSSSRRSFIYLLYIHKLSPSFLHICHIITVLIYLSIICILYRNFSIDFFPSHFESRLPISLHT